MSQLHDTDLELQTTRTELDTQDKEIYKETRLNIKNIKKQIKSRKSKKLILNQTLKGIGMK